jgi:AraC-type DNA-binding domain-containing proteins
MGPPLREQAIADRVRAEREESARGRDEAGPLPTSDLAGSYYYDRNPFLTELACALPAQMVVVPVLAKVDYGFTGLISGRDILQHSLRASVSELLLDSGKLGRLVQLEDGNWLVLVQKDLRGENPQMLIEGNEIDWAALRSRCLALRERFRSYWRCGVAFFIGAPLACRDLAAEYEILCAMGRDSASDSISFLREDRGENPADEAGEEAPPPDFGAWAFMLRGGDGHALTKEVTRYLIPRDARPRGGSAFLRGFQQDFLQMAYEVLKAKGIQAHELCDGGRASGLWDRSCGSVDDMLAWVSYVVLKVAELLEEEGVGATVVERVRSYVAANLESDLSRKSIAAQVGLNPDYLARIFKRETGLSICDFVQGERLAMARSLLSTTEMPICEIALQVGYKNFSHFAEAFRCYSGKNPIDFRRQPRAGGAAPDRSGPTPDIRLRKVVL